MVNRDLTHTATPSKNFNTNNLFILFSLKHYQVILFYNLLILEGNSFFCYNMAVEVSTACGN